MLSTHIPGNPPAPRPVAAEGTDPASPRVVLKALTYAFFRIEKTKSLPNKLSATFIGITEDQGFSAGGRRFIFAHLKNKNRTIKEELQLGKKLTPRGKCWCRLEKPPDRKITLVTSSLTPCALQQLGEVKRSKHSCFLPTIPSLTAKHWC